jgi:hypothetical protein
VRAVDRVAGAADDPDQLQATSGDEPPLGDLNLLARHAPIVRFNQGEYFLPASVEAFVARAELWERTGPQSRELTAEAGTLDLERLVELTDGQIARHYLRLVSHQLSSADLVAWKLRKDRPRFRAETRLGRVGVLARLVDAGARGSLLLRGRVPAGAEAAAALLDRDRPDHGDHPYYGRVVRSAGYLVLQYWFFSFFNDWRSRAHGVNDHEGDWEQVTIFLVEAPGEPPTPSWVAYSAHDEVGADLRRRWDDPDLTVIDGHPVVHAGLGSHSGAYLAGEYLISVRGNRLAKVVRTGRRVSRWLTPWRQDTGEEGFGIPYVDYSRGDGVAIGPGQNRPWRPVVVDDETPWVRRYTGLWGDDTNDPFGGERGPAGPRYERDGTVRRAWSDPVGWAALDAVVPDDEQRRAVITERVAELDEELRSGADRHERLRRRLRADVIGGASDIAREERELTDMAAQLTLRRDERSRLERLLDEKPPVPHPHAHLSHRNVPLPVDSGGRRRLMKAWATISTPMVFGLLALMALPMGRSIFTVAGVGMFVVLTLEAIARKRLLSFLVGAVAVAVAVVVAAAIVTGLIGSWQIALAALFILLALVFLVLNLGELRRT